MDHVEGTKHRHPSAATETAEDVTPLARRVLMFPLTRILIAAGLFIALQIAVGIGSGALPDAWQGPVPTQALTVWVALIVFGVTARVLERRTLAEDGLTRAGAVRDTALGFGLGAAMIAGIVGMLALAGLYDATGAGAGWPPLLSGLFLFLLVAVAEEVLFRGVLYRVLEEGVGSWAALGIIAVLFGVVHLFNDNATWLGALGTALVGVILGAAYVLTRSLWLAIGIHWSWNFVQGTIFGLPVSGRDAGAGLVESTMHGPELWTGGAFGIEAGMVAFLVTTVVSTAMLWVAVRRGRTIAPRWMRGGGDGTVRLVMAGQEVGVETP